MLTGWGEQHIASALTVVLDACAVVDRYARRTG